MSKKTDAGDSPASRHRWVYVRLGRVCQRCGLSQAQGEFDDTVPCSK